MGIGVCMCVENPKKSISSDLKEATRPALLHRLTDTHKTEEIEVERIVLWNSGSYPLVHPTSLQFSFPPRGSTTLTRENQNFYIYNMKQHE